jgi:MFS family permease
MLGIFNTRTAFFISVIIFTSGEILEAISIMPFIMNHTPETHRGRMSSVLPILMGMGFTIGPVVMGTVLENTSFFVSWIITGLVVLISTVSMIFIRRFDRNSIKSSVE